MFAIGSQVVGIAVPTTIDFDGEDICNSADSSPVVEDGIVTPIPTEPCPDDKRETEKLLRIRVVVTHPALSDVLVEDFSEMRNVRADLVDIAAVECDDFVPSGGDIVIVTEAAVERWCRWCALHPTPSDWVTVVGAFTNRWSTSGDSGSHCCIDVVDMKLPCHEIMRNLRALVKRVDDLRARDAQTRCIDRTLSQCLCLDDLDRRIVTFVTMGLMDREIAGKVHLSSQTVRNRVSRMLDRSSASNRTQLAVLCLLDPSMIRVQETREESTPRSASMVR